MASVTSKRKSGKRRKHSPELLRMKRAARALNIPWSQVTAERDRLRREELDDREYADSLHKAATLYYGGQGALPFWRGFFRRKFDKLIRSGGDYSKVRGFDSFVAEHWRPNDVVGEQLNGEYVTNGRTLDDAWELLIEDRPPLRSIWEVYEEAIYNIIQGKAGESATPF
jgi:hypothetical protein